MKLKEAMYGDVMFDIPMDETASIEDRFMVDKISASVKVTVYYPFTKEDFDEMNRLWKKIWCWIIKKY